MALTPAAFGYIAPLLRNSLVLTLGHPDILLSRQEMLEDFDVRCTLETPGAVHKRAAGMVDTAEVFRLFGAKQYHAVDIEQWRGDEHRVDLNERCELGQWDMVIDAGTTEHCANIGMALLNAASAVAPGGHVFHSPPLSMVNHGYYNICPVVLRDFYEHNGWGVKLAQGFEVKNKFKAFALPMGRALVPPESAIYFLAQRLAGSRAGHDNMTWPTQEKYRSKP